MGLKPSFDTQTPTTGAGCTDKYINTAYDEVKIVSDNIEAVIEVAENIPHSLKYLGAHTSPPDTRLDGSPIQDGDYYFNTMSNALVYYNEAEDTWFEVDPAEILNARDEAVAAAVAAETAQQAAEAAQAIAEAQAAIAVLEAQAAATSASNAAISESNASGSESNAETYASNALASENAAASSESNASQSANAASTSASEANTSAQNAANSEGAAATSASEASDSAQAANVSKVSAEQSAIASEASAQRAESAEENIDSIIAITKSKANGTPALFDKMREANRAQYNSGFLHFGNHHNVVGTLPNVNEGMYQIELTEANKNQIALGLLHGGSSKGGTSKTSFAVSIIAGLVSNLIKVNTTNNLGSRIKFPAAPDGTVTYDSSTGVVFDYATQTDPKYGDVAADTNEAVARAFEGLIGNGDFRDGTSLWNSAADSYSVTDRVMTVTDSTTGNVNAAMYLPVPEDGTVEYEISADMKVDSGTARIDWEDVDGAGDGAGNVTGGSVGVSGWTTYKFTAKPNSGVVNNLIQLFAFSGTVHFRNISIRKATNEVVTDRVDMYGFEWLMEEVTTTNPYVYANGMIQSQTATMNGVTTGDSNRPVTYYAVYDGDTTSRGKGVDLLACTDEQVAAIVGDASNNIFVTAEGKLVQWRCRQRTVAGLGNGDWNNTDPTHPSVGWLFNAGNNGIGVQAGADTVNTTWGFATTAGNANPNPETGIFTANAATAYNGECYFQVLGTVSRLNQGAYHPSFNKLGTAFLQSVNNAEHRITWWGDAAIDPVIPVASTLDCFTKKTTSSVGQGNIGTAANSNGNLPRPDDKFYDAIYPSGQGGVIDERYSAFDMSSPQEVSKVRQKVENGSFRGVQKMPWTDIYSSFATSALAQSNGIFVTDTSDWSIGDIVSVVHNGVVLIEKAVINSVSVNASVAWDANTWGTYNRVQGETYLVPHTRELSLSVEGNATNGFDLQTVIGNPASIIQTPQLAGGWLGHWSPEIPDGTSKPFHMVRKHIGSTSIGYQQSTDNGASWTSGSMAIDVVTNSSSPAVTTTGVRVCNITAAPYVTEQDVSREVYGGESGIATVSLLPSFNPIFGAILGESFIHKVITNNSVNHINRNVGAVRNYWVNGGAIGASIPMPEHLPLPSDIVPNNDSPAVKALMYQTAENQAVYVNFAYNELKHNGTDWGDDSTIKIVDGQSSYTNTNGETCLYGTNRLTKKLGHTINRARVGTQVEGVDL